MVFGLMRERKHKETVEAMEEKVDEHRQDSKVLGQGLDATINAVPRVDNKENVVQTLDEPRRAYKATRNGIVTLLIPEGARVVHPDDDYTTGPRWMQKRRTDKAIVVKIREYDAEGRGHGFYTGEVLEQDESFRSRGFKYTVGEMVEPRHGLICDTKVECTSGVHFFRSHRAAENWADQCQ